MSPASWKWSLDERSDGGGDEGCEQPLTIQQFMTWNILLVYVKYKEYYALVPLSATVSEIMPVPFQLVSDSFWLSFAGY